MSRKVWSRDEQLLALRLYFLWPFGQLHQKNPDVISVAESIGRTPSAVAMKACNFASLDPALKQKGLGNVSNSDRDLWREFMWDSESVSVDAELIYQKVVQIQVNPIDDETLSFPSGPTEKISEVRVRRVQAFFRKSVLVGYNNQCAISGLKIPELIIASHIIPWSVNEKRRADPTNGIARNALYDKAFDKGFMTFNKELRVVLSK